MRLPTEIFLTIIGVPNSDADLFVPWVEDFFAGFGGDLEQQQAMGAALGGIRQYWMDVLEARRGEANPRENDFVSLLLHSTVDGEPLGDDLILDILTVLVLAGLDTTRGQLGYLFRHLAEHPEDRQRLVAEPELIPSAVEESLRLYTIVFGDGRKVAQDTEFHGCPLARATWSTGWSPAPTGTRGSTTAPTSSSWTARPTTTSGSPADRTAASARTWPAWS